MNIRELIEGKDFYKEREYKSPHYEVPIPYRALSEFELSVAEDKAMEKVDTTMLNSLEKGRPASLEQKRIILKIQRLTDYWIIFYALRDFVDDLTFEITTRIKGASELADRIRSDSGLGTDKKIEDF